jgi:hypothetical protein
MGFKQRERKRKKKVAILAAQRQSRVTRSSAGRWWLTIVVRTTCCAACGGVLRVGREMVYRHTPREALCRLCAEDKGLSWRPSARLEEAWTKARRRRG